MKPALSAAVIFLLTGTPTIAFTFLKYFSEVSVMAGAVCADAAVSNGNAK